VYHSPEQKFIWRGGEKAEEKVTGGADQITTFPGMSAKTGQGDMLHECTLSFGLSSRGGGGGRKKNNKGEKLWESKFILKRGGGCKEIRWGLSNFLCHPYGVRKLDRVSNAK